MTTRFLRRSLAHKRWRYLRIDARYEKVRVAGHVVSQAVLVTAGLARAFRMGHTCIFDRMTGNAIETFEKPGSTGVSPVFFEHK